MFSLSKSLVFTGIAASALLLPPAPSGTYLIAHRGASAYAPEHTAEAYRLAMEQGADYVEPDLAVSKDARARLKHQKPAVLWFTGLSGAGKSTIANLVEREGESKAPEATLPVASST